MMIASDASHDVEFPLLQEMLKKHSTQMRFYMSRYQEQSVVVEFNDLDKETVYMLRLIELGISRYRDKHRHLLPALTGNLFELEQETLFVLSRLVLLDRSLLADQWNFFVQNHLPREMLFSSVFRRHYPAQILLGMFTELNPAGRYSSRILSSLVYQMTLAESQEFLRKMASYFEQLFQQADDELLGVGSRQDEVLVGKFAVNCLIKLYRFNSPHSLNEFLAEFCLKYANSPGSYAVEDIIQSRGLHRNTHFCQLMSRSFSGPLDFKEVRQQILTLEE